MARSKGNQQQRKQGQQWELPAGSKVWVYLRHSPGDAQTIDSQQSGMRQWCAQVGWTIEREFIDEAQEGSKEEREQFQHMMSLSRQVPRPVDGIVVWSFSRFARSQLDSQYYKAELRKRGYVVVSKIDDVPNNEIAPIIESVIDWKNQRFLEDMSLDVKRGKQYLVDKGFLPGHLPPAGYRTVQEEIGRRHNGEIRYGHRVVKDEELADRVALAWRMKLQDNAPYGVIHQATRLFALKHNFYYFFNNLLYAGIFVHDGKWYPLDWEQGARFCEPYVTLDEFYQVQRLREERRITVVAPRSLSSRYLMTGLLHCACCAEMGFSSHLTGGHAKAPINHVYYRCTAHATTRNAACPLPQVGTWQIDDAVLGILREKVLTLDYVSAEVERANAKLATKGADVRMQLHQVERAVKEREKRVESLVKLIEKKGLTAILERQYDEANKEWLEATTQLATLRDVTVQTQISHISQADVQRCLDDLTNVLDAGTLLQKQKLVKQFVERIDVGLGWMDVWLRFHLDELVNLPPSYVAANNEYVSNSPDNWHR